MSYITLTLVGRVRHKRVVVPCCTFQGSIITPPWPVGFGNKKSQKDGSLHQISEASEDNKV